MGVLYIFLSEKLELIAILNLFFYFDKSNNQIDSFQYSLGKY
jgi:hypothetical protein